MHGLTNNLPQRLAQLAAVSQSWLDSLLTKLVEAMVHGSLLLATAPQRFPAGRLVFSACRAGACGLVMGESLRGAALQLPEDVAATPFGIGY